MPSIAVFSQHTFTCEPSIALPLLHDVHWTKGVFGKPHRCLRQDDKTSVHPHALKLVLQRDCSLLRSLLEGERQEPSEYLIS